MGLRILFLGENWYGSCARACCYALRRLGCNVVDIDAQTFFPQVRRFTSRVALRLASPHLVREYNERILQVASDFRPDLLLAFKGTYVAPETLRTLRKSAIALYNYYPDRVALALGTLTERSLPEYDCLFDTKLNWDGDTASRIRPRQRVFLPHGYDPEVHRPLPLEERDRKQYGCDVSLIATHMPVKEEILDRLVAMRPHLDVAIWGDHWQNCRSSRLRRLIRGGGLRGISYSKAIQASRINLALMGVTPAARDETSTRTFEIPACGGLMLHARSREVLTLYEEGKEMVCFSSTEELADQIDHLLANPDLCDSVARAGHARCVPAYSYDTRMAQIPQWHAQSRQHGTKTRDDCCTRVLG